MRVSTLCLSPTSSGLVRGMAQVLGLAPTKAEQAWIQPSGGKTTSGDKYLTSSMNGATPLCI